MTNLHPTRGAAAAIVLVGIIVILVLVGAAVYLLQGAPSDPASGINPPEATREQASDRDSELVPVNGAAAPADMITYTGQVLAGTSSPLLDFNQADYERALQSDKLVVLYFYANWCPICARETREALYPAFNELSTDEVVGFRVNFKDNETDDNEVALAREFGIAYQHSKVFLKNGERVLKSPEEWGKARYLSEIQQAI